MDGRPRRHTSASGAHSTNTLKGSDTPRLKEFFKREMLVAKRNGSWFRLGRVERGVYSLAMRLDVRLESAMLLRALVGALKKLKEMGDAAYAAIVGGSASPPPGVGEPGLGGVAYFDVKVTGISDGSARVCIASVGLPSDAEMEYWSGSGWVGVSGVSVSASGVCGEVPVSALAGTTFAVGSPAATITTTTTHASTTTATTTTVQSTTATRSTTQTATTEVGSSTTAGSGPGGLGPSLAGYLGPVAAVVLVAVLAVLALARRRKRKA